jgi:hypothetical protein
MAGFKKSFKVDSMFVFAKHVKSGVNLYDHYFLRFLSNFGGKNWRSIPRSILGIKFQYFESDSPYFLPFFGSKYFKNHDIDPDRTCFPSTVPCPEGTFFDTESRVCSPCPIGTYNKEAGQLECQKCPEFQGKPGVTETLGAVKVDECKGTCAWRTHF